MGHGLLLVTNSGLIVLPGIHGVRSVSVRVLRSNHASRALSALRSWPGFAVRMCGQGTGGEIIERLARRIDLIVMPSVREGEQFIEPGRHPGRVLRHVHLTGLKPRRLREKARLLVEPGFLQDCPMLARAP